jgi:S-DNA-T family DNA segregation ATPase FtsK/SpoIIIE
MLLRERNVLIGGEPGAGKSVALSMLVAAAALDAGVRLSLFDGKLVALAMWEGCAEHYVEEKLDEAIKVLEELGSDMVERYRYLKVNFRRKISREDTQFPLRLVVVDELAVYTATGDKKLCDKFSNLLRDLVSRGRAAGIIVVAATQKPSSDIVPTALRDLFGFRWAMRWKPESSGLLKALLRGTRPQVAPFTQGKNSEFPFRAGLQPSPVGGPAFSG